MPSASDRAHALKLVDDAVKSLRQGDLDESEASFELALEFAELAPIYDGLGCVALMRNNYEEAKRYFFYAISLDEQYTDVYGNLAMLYEVQGQVGAAEAMYEYAIAEDPDNYRVRNNFAAFQMRQQMASRGDIRKQLFKARALAPHPLIDDNIERLR